MVRRTGEGRELLAVGAALCDESLRCGDRIPLLLTRLLLRLLLRTPLRRRFLPPEIDARYVEMGCLQLTRQIEKALS